MQNLFSNLLRLGITVSISDRETFVSKVSEVIEGFNKEPEKAGKWAKAILDYLEDTKSNINLETSIKSAVSDSDFPDKSRIDELTQAIKNLTQELQQQKEKK
ncbi:MAG: hypothetical protein SH857_06225 [Chitinophagales bacterium]|nr:hypothetical protein [Chitinophagales bacterium]